MRVSSHFFQIVRIFRLPNVRSTVRERSAISFGISDQSGVQEIGTFWNYWQRMLTELPGCWHSPLSGAAAKSLIGHDRASLVRRFLRVDKHFEDHVGAEFMIWGRR
jgi:hypothetical protein